MTTEKTITDTSGGEQKTRELAAAIPPLRFGIFNRFTQEFWKHESTAAVMLFSSTEAAQRFMEKQKLEKQTGDDNCVADYFNHQSWTFNRSDFMDFFRNTEALNTLSVEDRHEVFRTIMPGSSDFTVELLQSVLSDYSVGGIKVSEHNANVVKHTETPAGEIQCAHCGREYDDLTEAEALKLSNAANKCLDDDCPGPKVVTLGNMRNKTELRINATLSNDDEGLSENDFLQLVQDVQGLYAFHGKDIKVFARQDAPFVVAVD